MKASMKEFILRTLLGGVIYLFIFVNVSYATIMGGSTNGTITKPTTLKVVLVQFADVHWDSFYNASSGKWIEFNQWHKKSYFEDMLASRGSYFGQRFNGENIHGSFRDYFWEISKQNYDPTVTVLNNPDANGYPIWVTLTGDKTSYSFSSFISAARIAAINQLELLPGDLPDTGGGPVRVCYIYAGRWCTGINVATTLNGPAMAVPERDPWNRAPGESETAKLGHVGYYCHEFGHMMGSAHPHADVYRWCLMMGGHKNGDVHANRPAPMNPWLLYKAEWADSIHLTDYMPETDLIYNTSPNTPGTYYIREFSGSRRYLVENRQQGNNFDGGLPHVHENMEGGILIWRINDDGLDENETTIIPADDDPTSDWSNKAMDMFRPTGSIPYNKITDYSTPADLKLNSSEYSHFAVVNFYENGNPITIDFVINYWEGPITSNTTWPTTTSNYYVGDDITIENSATLSIESNAIVDLYGNAIKVINGILDRQENVTINPDIQLFASGTTLVGQYSTIQQAIADASAGDEIKVNSDLTIDADIDLLGGYLLTISPGVSLQFAPATSLNVYGKLYAWGAWNNRIGFDCSNPSSYWQGIKFHEGSDENSRLCYCDISHATFGIFMDRTTPGIRYYNTISNCVYGIFGRYACPDIDRNDVDFSAFIGINLQYVNAVASWHILMNQNSLGFNHDGIYLYQSDAFIWNYNIICGSSNCGIYANVFCDLQMNYDYYPGEEGYNTIESCGGPDIWINYQSDA